MGDDAFKFLEQWFSERPIWLRSAATRLLNQPKITDQDINELSVLCQKEIQGKVSSEQCSFSASMFYRDDCGSLRLKSIGNIEGVNALAPKKPLVLGDGNLTIVYGNNGSGKSGYVRLLKHVCAARDPGLLHSNIYKSTPKTQRADIEFELGGKTTTVTWSKQDACYDLRGVDIFDTSFGRIITTTDTEVSYEPPVLSFFSSLVEVCEKVAGVLDAEINKLQSKKPNMPSDTKTTPEGIWYDSITTRTRAQDIDKHCSFESKDVTELQILQLRIAEQAPLEKAKQIRTQIQHITSLIQDTRSHIEQLSEENIRKIVKAKANLQLKKKAADVIAEKAFSGNHLEGVGSDVWKELWETARSYSLSAAYKNIDYPNVAEEARCVLCHQILSPEAKKRFLSFESFVKGEAQKAATLTEQEYSALIEGISNIPLPVALKTKLDAAGIQHEEITREVVDFYLSLQSRKDQIVLIESEGIIPSSISNPKWIENVETYSKKLNEQVKQYEDDAKNDHREETKRKLNSLQAKKWLSEHRKNIEEELERLKKVDHLQNAKKLTHTKALSDKKGDLAEVLITDAFVKRFNSELKALGAVDVNVELVKTKVSKGRVLHKLQLRGASTHPITEVLSEGEHRIVSIASFLADVTGKNNKTPFVFDDPISSLDQNYEEAVVQRLIDLSVDKQVIVFTHRLSLLGTIKHFAEKKSIKPVVVSIRTSGWGTGEPAPLPISQSDIKTALNILINQRYPEVKKSNEEGAFEHTEILLTSICSDFRLIVERSIENDLLCGIVQRFQRPVHTQKLKELSKLRYTDFTLLDFLMTKYSRFEHSQPPEAPISLPNPEELLLDMQSLKDWREEYSNRKLAVENMISAVV